MLGYFLQISKGVIAYGKIKEFVEKIGINMINIIIENKKHDKKSQNKRKNSAFNIPPNLIFVLILI